MAAIDRLTPAMAAAIGASAAIVPMDVPMAVEINAPTTNSPGSRKERDGMTFVVRLSDCFNTPCRFGDCAESSSQKIDHAHSHYIAVAGTGQELVLWMVSNFFFERNTDSIMAGRAATGADIW